MGLTGFVMLLRIIFLVLVSINIFVFVDGCLSIIFMRYSNTEVFLDYLRSKNKEAIARFIMPFICIGYVSYTILLILRAIQLTIRGLRYVRILESYKDSEKEEGSDVTPE